MSSSNNNWNRRSFLKTLSLASFYPLMAGAPAIKLGSRDITITKIILQEAKGMRPTPVAPNAYAKYRGREVSENVLRIQTDKGIEGVTELYADPQKKKSMLKQLLGKNPFDLYTWSGDWVTGPNPEHEQLVDQLYGADMAIFDIFGKVMNKPVADILGRRVRDTVPIYDSSLYMEDLLTEEQRRGLIYLDNGHPENPDRYTYPDEFSPAMLENNARVTITGHTHVQGVREFEEGVVMNPGSVGQPRDGDPAAAFAVLDIGDGDDASGTSKITVETHRVSYDIDRVIDAVEDAGLPEKIGTRLRSGR